MKVVVAGDNAELVSFVARYLSCQGFTVVAVSGDEKVQARLHQVDYVLRPNPRWLFV